MSSTRYAKDGQRHPQERFASSFETGGLKANLVVKKTASLGGDPELREIIWFLQQMSWDTAGTHKLAERIVAFQGCSFKYAEDREAAIRDWDIIVERLCLAPEYRLFRGRLTPEVEDGTPFLPSDLEVLKRFRTSILDGQSDLVRTSVMDAVWDILDWTKRYKDMSLMEGNSGVGKTSSVEAWCARNRGFARYVEVPNYQSDVEFFKKIAESLGVATAQKKRHELARDVQKVLTGASGELMLVLDEAHYLWPQNVKTCPTPDRVNWIMTALANNGVPVAMISTPDRFQAALSQVEKRTSWNSNQFRGRIGRRELLPDISQADCQQIVEKVLPFGINDQALCWALAKCCQISPSRIRAIPAIIKNAEWFASRDGRELSREDIVRATQSRAEWLDLSPDAPKRKVQPSPVSRESSAGLVPVNRGTRLESIPDLTVK
jgi:hypothetical protein